MDIQAIIKQVISLAGMVIKNPSTSVKGSGIDFGSLIGMAGSMLGGKSGSSAGSSTQGCGIDLGSLIGMAGSMMGGAKTTTQQSDDNPLGSILPAARSNKAAKATAVSATFSAVWLKPD